MEETSSCQYVLYIQGSDTNGLKALRYVQYFPDLFLVRDVDDLQRKPDWLTGTPSLLSLSTNKLYRGSHALQKLASIKKKLENPSPPPRPPPVPSSPSNSEDKKEGQNKNPKIILKQQIEESKEIPKTEKPASPKKESKEQL